MDVASNQALAQPGGCLGQALNRLGHLVAERAEFVVVVHRVDDRSDFCDEVGDGGAVVQGKLSQNQIDRLYAVGPLVDRCDARVSIVLGGAGLFDVPHAPVDLEAQRRHLSADVGAPCLHYRSEDGEPRLGLVPPLLRLPMQPLVALCRGRVDEGAHCLGIRLDRQEHSPNVGVDDDGYVFLRLGADLPALDPLLRVAECSLVDPLGYGDALHPHTDPGRVHHREHVSHAVELVANQVANCAVAALAEGHDTRR